MIYFSSHLPGMRIPEAGQKICIKNIESLVKKYGDELNVISICNSKEFDFIEDYNVFLKEQGISVSKVINLKHSRKLKNIIYNIWKYPGYVSTRVDSDVLVAFNSFAKNNSVKVFLDYEQSAALLFETEMINFNGSFVFFHDICSQLFFRKFKTLGLKNFIKKSLYFLEYKRLLNFERRISRTGITAIVLSDKDKLLLSDIGFKNILVKPPIVSEFFHNIVRAEELDNSIFFWGAMSRVENEQAVLFFVSQIFPVLLKHNPKLSFHIVGASPSETIMRLASDNIFVTGFVEDPSFYFSKCKAMVSPLINGAGVKIKVLEAIAANVPVVASTVGAEGVPESELLRVADDAEDFIFSLLEIVGATNAKC